jgi:glutamate 5-kinase
MKPSIAKRIKNSKIVIIKVGSARVSGDKKNVNDFLYGLTGSIRKLRDEGKKVVLVSSGAIAQGRSVYKDTFSKEIKSKVSLNEKQALAAMGQNKLMKLYENFFSQVNIPIAQILFGKADIQSEEGYKNLSNTFKKLLDWNILPIVNENDSIATEELNLGDNDLLSAMVASLLGADVLLILTSVDGYLKQGKLISYMDTVSDEEFSHALGPSGPGTGGMNTKLKAAKILLNFGVTTCILNGTDPSNMDRFFEGKGKGTVIASTTPLREKFKYEEWMRRFLHE